MSVNNPAFQISRRTVAGNENEFVKIFDGTIGSFHYVKISIFTHILQKPS